MPSTQKTRLSILEGEAFNSIVLDNLYEDFKKLVAIKYIDADFLYINTTGLYEKPIKMLIDLFESIEYVPKNVIFANERSLMTLFELAKEMKYQGTKLRY